MALFRARRAAGLIAAAAVAGTVALAQSQPDPPASPPPQQPTFRSGVDSVSVDVVVTDKQGRPITDLTAQDFEIREDGKPQTVEAFRFVQIDDGFNDNAARSIVSLEDQAREAAREDNRLLVVFLDDYHTRLENSMVVRERLAQFVLGLTPHDLVAVTVPLMPAAGLTFSRNHEETAAAIMNFVGRKYDYRPKNRIEEQYAYEPPETQERLRNQWTMSGLLALSSYMGGLRDGRKSLLFVSEGMSSIIPAGVKTMGYAGLPSTPVGGPNPEGRAASQQYFTSVELMTDLERVFRTASRSNTAIYTLDPRGLAVSEFSVADNVTQSMDRQMLQQATDQLRSMADETDGRAIVGRNDYAPALNQMLRDGSAYYLMAYTSSAAPRDGRFHQIQVRVKRKDVDVRARKGYWAISAEEADRILGPSKPPVPEAVTEALNALGNEDSSRRGGPNVWLGAARGASEKPAVTLAWETGDAPGIEPLDRVDHLQVVATSASGDVVFSGAVERNAQADRPAGQTVFDAPPGTLSLRIESLNANNRRLDVSDTTFDVPDFTATTAQITSPFVYRGRTARDIAQIRAAAAPLATPSRSFARAERMLLRFDAYGPGGIMPAVTARLLNQNGDALATLPGPANATGNTFEIDLALGPFPPGSYLIEITATAADSSVKRVVAFRVTG